MIRPAYIALQIESDATHILPPFLAKEIPMKGYLVHIEDATRDNQHDRRVLFTPQHSQLVLMNIKPGEEIGEEVYESDAPLSIHGRVYSDLSAPSK